MLIGGSSGSTAVGIKTVTFLVLLLFIGSRLRGKETVDVFKRNIPAEKVMDAATIVAVLTGLSLLGAIVISGSGVSFTDALFETASALGTVGITAGITPSLNLLSQLMIILFMYFGRVGILTISLSFLMADQAAQRFRYAQTNILIG